MRLHLPIALTLLALLLGADAPPSDPNHFWELEKTILQPYLQGGSREDLLQRCQAELAAGTAGYYKQEFTTLVAALEHEPKPPEGYDKPAAQRTKEQTLRCWIYDLREEGSSFGWSPVGTPAEHLVASGPAAMDALIDTLEDFTPTRSEGMEVGLSLTAILRRQDLALQCIERISACTFYRRTGGRGIHLYNDHERQSVIANIQNWWKQAQGQSQAEGLRIQKRLRSDNTSLNKQDYDETAILWKIALLEGPENVIENLRGLLASEHDWLNSSLAQNMMQIEPQSVLHNVFEDFHNHQERPGQHVWLIRYGDKKNYQEMVRRAAASGDLGPGSWNHGDEARVAAIHGKAWAIPLVAVVLKDTEMTGSRGFGKVQSQRFCSADEAVEVFQQLTGKDFGYVKEAGESERLAAIKRAAEWWQTDGPKAMAGKIDEDHPVVTDDTDMLDTPEQSAARIAALNSPDDAKVRAAVAACGQDRERPGHRASGLLPRRLQGPAGFRPVSAAELE